jgi:hypothetical protein
MMDLVLLEQIQDPVQGAVNISGRGLKWRRSTGSASTA